MGFDTQSANGRLEIIAYSDYVCPWCYIGNARIERLRREFDVHVEWRPFELHPETPTTGSQMVGRLGGAARARAYRENIVALGEDAGLHIRMPHMISNSHRALEAAEAARQLGGFDAMHAALFRAYFEDGRDIGDVDVLAETARECGVGDQQVRQALADERFSSVIDEITDEARANGIVSTPTFVFTGGFQLVGAQEYAVFASVTQRLIERQSANAGT